MTIFMKWGMFILSYIPLYFLLAIQHLEYKKIPYTLSKLSVAWSENSIQFWFWLTLIILCIISGCALLAFLKIR